ncbi:VOC family protein [Paenibacillus sp. UMB4589-SE434]|uniref:VOC family protein n=1 Tax=Paenibacillus sp. UMB4589-SE434 TaxID=3046314 RepID=UPI00254D9E41|nr:VOC family protein [Paenibacillus sp. UMB4589-SE434]MDK8179973.1 VOC family protein [Paenibacillus sp. UMB4589-SE434]
MHAEIKFIHHVGHVVSDMEAALELYKKLGFVCSPPSYPAMSENEGEPPKPFGAANSHAEFLGNFIEIVTVVKQGARIPDNAKLVPLQASPDVQKAMIGKIKQTVDTVSRYLSRYEGAHILCFGTEDADKTADRFHKKGIAHSGVNTVQRPLERSEGIQFVPVRYLEIDGGVHEGRLAVAENPPSAIVVEQVHPNHPNGATDLIESILCVDDSELDEFIRRYGQYLECEVQTDGVAHIFNLAGSRITIVPRTRLSELLPGEMAPPVPGFAGYVVAVRDISHTRSYLERNDLPVAETASGDLFVPAASALGSAIVFKKG